MFLDAALPELEDAISRATRGPAPLDAAARLLVTAGGKRVRPLTALLSCAISGGEPRAAVPFAAAAELVHSATLLHDDVIDEGEERRGRPAARVVHGNLVSVLAGDLLLTRALAIVDAERIPEAMADLLATLERLVGGEVAQLAARGRTDLGVDGYLRIVEGKTASLFGFACRAGARAARTDAARVDALGRLGEHIGVAFQVIDDVLDLSGDPERVGKRLGADLAEGKTTLPLVHALDEDAARVGPLLEPARHGDAGAAREVAALPSVRRGCERARAFAGERTRQALAELGGFPEGGARALLGRVVAELAHRAA